jgi:hypothetical protein
MKAADHNSRSSQWKPLIADGYHRVCANYYRNQDTDIPLKLAHLPQ